MTKLTWDDLGKRYFETGLDRGVLYFGPKNLGVPWNGLISVDETVSEEETVVTLDGVPQTTYYTITDFKAVLNAFTYPDLFLEAQESKFGLSYRVMVGNDISGTSSGYQIHLLYNLTANISDIAYESYSTNPNIVTFSWELNSIPEEITGFKPTAHVVIDSRFVEPDLLLYLEDVLYNGDLENSSVLAATYTPYVDSGLSILPAEVINDSPVEAGSSTISPYDSDVVGPRLLPLSRLLSIVSYFKAIRLIPNETTGIATFELGYGDLTMTSVDGIYNRLPTTRLSISDVDGCYFLIEE